MVKRVRSEVQQVGAPPKKKCGVNEEDAPIASINYANGAIRYFQGAKGDERLVKRESNNDVMGKMTTLYKGARDNERVLFALV